MYIVLYTYMRYFECCAANMAMLTIIAIHIWTPITSMADTAIAFETSKTLVYTLYHYYV